MKRRENIYLIGFSKWSFIKSYYQLWQVIVTSKKLIIVPHGVLNFGGSFCRFAGASHHLALLRNLSLYMRAVLFFLYFVCGLCVYYYTYTAVYIWLFFLD